MSLNLILNKAVARVSWAQAATELIARRQQNRRADRLPKALRPVDTEDGWQIQQEVSRGLRCPVAGWKCALPSKDKLVVAAIYADGVHTAHALLPARQDMQHDARFEPEIAYLLAHDLPPRALAYTPAEVDAAVLNARCALEVIGSRYNNDAEIPFAEQLADGLLNAGLVLGPVIDDSNWWDFELTVEVAGAVPLQLAARHPDGHPRAGLYWLANFLCGQGHYLQAGQAVITGSLAGVMTLPAGKTIKLHYGNIGLFEFKFDYLNEENIQKKLSERNAL